MGVVGSPASPLIRGGWRGFRHDFTSPMGRACAQAGTVTRMRVPSCGRESIRQLASDDEGSLSHRSQTESCLPWTSDGSNPLAIVAYHELHVGVHDAGPNAHDGRVGMADDVVEAFLGRS